MGKVQLLDCTLRDGGYVNDWRFGGKVIRDIVKKLDDAHIDIIECGFLSEVDYDENVSLFPCCGVVSGIIPREGRQKYVAMVALGEKEPDIDKIEERAGGPVSGIRLTFHKHEIDRAGEIAVSLMKKGYEVYIQPVGIISYKDIELLQMIDIVNEINPYAFYIVDTLGTLDEEEVLRLFQMVDHNLLPGIRIGFHAHNNLELAFSNAQSIIRLYSKRNLIIDSSIMGMGRGAGNLGTELIAHFFNANIEMKYKLEPLLEAADNYLVGIKKEHPWGYSLPYYIAAINKCHPNYATYLMNRQTLTINDIERIINGLDAGKRILFDKDYIHAEYMRYLENSVEDGSVIEKYRDIFGNRTILLLGPGKSVVMEADRVKRFIAEHNAFVIKVNYNHSDLACDLIFLSNLKRLEQIQLSGNERNQIMVTSNIAKKATWISDVINYSSYLGTEELVSDDAGLMACRFLKKCGVSKVYIAGFDGFRADTRSNYYNEEMINNVDVEKKIERNARMRKEIALLRKEIEIRFITKSLYEEEIHEQAL